ncbi:MULTISPECIES: hypothetical protein [Cytobacillus]|uniref:Uncharacterized protein n=1 Tax=Cytobacillus oceanisediminis TaxID=665099 RepID=A0ABX3CMX8_9BACI|nr:hypothetical protein [Cytobacillus oceanisediminis]EFV75014.1 hypothetical protein HMPREF1013_04787 [Bacillus sp. 2_A_57_CT2]MCM3402940.1 hypothetical protein [Cytobacillus oceanisediminis]OHX45031.1 hypothetical protein BBV17_24210 [Cytobacillus oceanisediminis]
MTESIIYFNLGAVKFFNKPYYDGKKWHNFSLNEGELFVLISETRAAMLRVPVSQDEEPYAYIYSVYGQGEECYLPVFNRTGKVKKEDLFPSEIISYPLL